MRINEFLDAQLRLSEATKVSYRGDLERFGRFTGGEDPTEENILAYVAELIAKGRSEAHVMRILYALKKYCQWAGRPEVFARIEPPPFEVKTPTQVIDVQDVQRLIDASPTPLESALVGLIFDSAIRIGEARRLDVEDVDWDTGEVSVRRKGRRQRREVVALFPGTLQMLKEYREWAGIRKGPLFPHTYRELLGYLNELARRAGVSLPRYSKFHNLRHARAVSERLAGDKIEDISDRLGHRSLNTTLKIYGPLDAIRLRDRTEPPPWER